MSKADVLIQAGHEGGWRNGPRRSSGTSGIAGRPSERELTPLVADEVTRVLRAAGVSVIRQSGVLGRHDVKLAVFLHFDGSGTACASGASVGYPAGRPAGSNAPAALAWKRLYGAAWPFQWMPDNFTAALRGYYGYGYTTTDLAEVLIEFGELTCPVQNTWLVAAVRNGDLGRLVAQWAGDLIGADVPRWDAGLAPLPVPAPSVSPLLPADFEPAPGDLAGPWETLTLAGVFNGRWPVEPLRRADLAGILTRDDTRRYLQEWLTAVPAVPPPHVRPPVPDGFEPVDGDLSTPWAEMARAGVFNGRWPFSPLRRADLAGILTRDDTRRYLQGWLGIGR